MSHLRGFGDPKPPPWAEIAKKEPANSGSSRGGEAIGCLGCGLAIVLLPFYMVLRGIVIRQLWGWFILPLFPSLEPLTILQALGLSLVLSYLAGPSLYSKMTRAEEKKEPWEVLFLTFCCPVLEATIALVVGYGLYYLMTK